MKSEGRIGYMTCVDSSAENTLLGQLSENTAKADAVPFGISQNPLFQ